MLKHFSPFRTLRGRLAITYAGLALLAVVVSALYTTSTLRAVMLERIGLDLSDEARLMADAIAVPLAAGDTAAVSAYVERTDPLSNARVLVVDRRGVPIASTAAPPNTLQASEPGLQEALAGRGFVITGIAQTGGTELIQVTLPVFDASGAVVGALRATYNLEDIQDTIARSNATAALGALSAALLAAGVAILLATSFARPVQRVVDAARELAAGRPVPALPDPRAGAEEVRMLVRAFNSLSSQLAVYEEARREFASDVSHELHALASAMQTAAEALERGAAEANPELSQRLVAGLVGHTGRLTRLADDLLELARLEGGRLRLDLTELDVADLVEQVRDEWTAEAERRGQPLEVALPSDPMAIRGDPARLCQALGNLVENALKYSGSGGHVRIEVDAETGADGYAIAVADSGPGIPPDVLPRVFERYYRVEGRASAGPGGMGLGLAIARGIALAHGGSLTADSPPGGGARFTLRIPRASSASGRADGEVPE